MQQLVDLAGSIWGLWLMLVFIAICVWVFWPSRKADLERHGRIPLEDGENGDGR